MVQIRNLWHLCTYSVTAWFVRRRSRQNAKSIRFENIARALVMVGAITTSAYPAPNESKIYKVALPEVWTTNESSADAYESSFHAGFTRSRRVQLDTSNTSEMLKAQFSKSVQKEETTQLTGDDCPSCLSDIAKAMSRNYDYVVSLSVKELKNATQISVQFAVVRQGLPPIQGYTVQAYKTDSDVLELIEAIAEYISYSEFTLRAKVLHIDTEEEKVSLDVGRNYKIEKGNVFIILSEAIQKQEEEDIDIDAYSIRELGRVKVTEVSGKSSTAELSKGKLFNFKTEGGKIIAELEQTEKLEQSKKKYYELLKKNKEKIKIADSKDQNIADKKKEAEEV
ncbi:MAG TPA: hypothetical protein PLY93_15510 [Turneriella sp.]|nr:hypothetical protein [Turneriella sp.]